MKTGTRPGGIFIALVLLALPLLACAQPGMMYDGQRQQPSGEYPYGPGYGPGWGMTGGYGPGYGMGPGMMGGYGPGWGHMGGGYGPGYGMGPGMMGGYGPGWGHMGGYGPGPGMMGGYGPGPGMGAGLAALNWLDLNDEQRNRINDIQRQARERQWKLHNEMIEQQTRLNELYGADELDAKKIGEVQGSIAKLQQQMAQAGVETHNRIVEVLTPEQREQLRQWRRQAWGGGPRGGEAYGPGRRFNR